MREVLTDLSEKIDTQKIPEKNFLICGGGWGQWYLAVKQQSTAHKINYILICFCVMDTVQKKLLLMYNSSEYIN